MKKLFLSGSFFLLLVLFLVKIPSFVFAQEENSMVMTPTPTPISIKYDLAFPGILPDNPLYKIKVLRDKISLMLISSPQKRVDYYLLQADKGILAAAILIDKNEIDLAGQTALKAENNMTMITYELERFLQKPSSELFNKLETASLKHQEVLDSLINRVSGDKKEVFKTVKEFSQRNLKSIEKFKKKKYYDQK